MIFLQTQKKQEKPLALRSLRLTDTGTGECFHIKLYLSRKRAIRI